MLSVLSPEISLKMFRRWQTAMLNVVRSGRSCMNQALSHEYFFVSTLSRTFIHTHICRHVYDNDVQNETDIEYSLFRNMTNNITHTHTHTHTHTYIYIYIYIYIMVMGNLKLTQPTLSKEISRSYNQLFTIVETIKWPLQNTSISKRPEPFKECIYVPSSFFVNSFEAYQLF